MAVTTLVVSRCNCPYPYLRHHRTPSPFFSKPKPKLPPLLSSLRTNSPPLPLPRRRRDVSAAYGDDMDDDFGDFDPDDVDSVGEDEDIDNEQDYDVDYDRLLAPVKPPPPSLSGEEGDIAMVAAESFVSTQDSASDTVVDYAVDEDEFHKIRLLHCDFLIRKVPDPDDDVFDFREMYVTLPDTDIYSIPRVLAPMPQKYVRSTKKNFARYHVSEPPVEHLRDPLYKTEREIMKVFLTKHYRNRRLDDPYLFLDFEEIYVIDSKTRSMTSKSGDGLIASRAKRKGSPCQRDDDSQGGEVQIYSGPSLPEDIWHHIHSLMPMRDAARAACVSHAFLRSWRCHPNLNLSNETLGLNENACGKDESARVFYSKVDHILKKHSGIGVKKLKIQIASDFSEKDSCYLNSWLQTAVTPGIEELTLILIPMKAKYNFPYSLLSNGSGDSIRYLHLGRCSFHPTVALGCLRSLTRLHICLVRITGTS